MGFGTYLKLAGVTAAFLAGWFVNGWRWESKWLDREVEIAADVAEHQEAVSKAVLAAREEEAIRRRELEERLTTAVTDALRARQEREAQMRQYEDEIRRLQRDDPEAADWLATPLPDSVRGLFPPTNPHQAGDRPGDGG